MQTRVVDPEPEDEHDHGPSHEVEPPAELVEPQTEKRLCDALRGAARTGDSDEILARAVVTSHGTATAPNAWRLARALTDLAVTGSQAAALFAQNGTSPADLAGMASQRLPGVGADDPALRAHAVNVYERAHAVHELLGLAEAERRRRRRRMPQLEPWLAVSGEDDPPRWPVNVPMSPHPTRRVDVRVDERDLSVRYMWAGPSDGSAKLLFFLHGHSSKLEEHDRLVDRLLAMRTARGAPKYCVVVPDLPSCGYTSRIDHEDIADVDAPGAPILAFLERFAARFLEAVCAERGLPARAAAVGGGSLGGNLGLRLAEARVPWAERFIAWSPASVWSSMQGDWIKGCALDRTKDRMVEEEGDASRRRYFAEVFADTICATGRTQPQMWYRDGYACRARHINRVLWDRREIYGPEFRRWHWRVAHEQLRFSHVERSDGRAPWQSIAGPLLLVAGADDNYRWTHIHSRTRDLGTYLTGLGVPGHCVLMRDTGHSIHDERPSALARHIDAFVDAF